MLGLVGLWFLYLVVEFISTKRCTLSVPEGKYYPKKLKVYSFSSHGINYGSSSTGFRVLDAFQPRCVKDVQPFRVLLFWV